MEEKKKIKSFTELKDQIILAKDVGYLARADFETLLDQANSVHRLLQGLITKSKSILNS